MESISFSRLFMAVSLILLYVVHRLVGLSHQASPLNLKPTHEDSDMRHLAFEDQLQFIDTDDYRTEKFLEDIELDSISVSYLSVSVLLFELNERQGCLEAANYSVIRTFSAVNVGQMVLRVRGFRFGSSSAASNILRGRMYNIAKSSQNQQQQQQKSLNHYTTPTNQQQPNNRHQQQQLKQQQQQINDNEFEGDMAIKERSVCQGYGFTIFDCEPFDLEPNHEHKIRIAFSPDFTLTKTIVSLTILTNLDKEFKFALVASIPRNLLASCNRSLPRPEWEPTMHLILAFGMVVMILVSVLIAYMEAILYLRSQQRAMSHSSINQAVTQNNSHNGGSQKDYDRTNNCSNQSTDACNKDHRSNGNGHGATAISASISTNQHHSSPLPLNALSSSNSSKNNNNNSNSVTSSNNKHQNITAANKPNTSNNNNSLTQKRRKNSNANSEKVPTSNKSLGGSAMGDKKSTSPYAPIFQNLTNVIASPPPPLPTFDSEFDSPDFRKLRNKKSAKKPNSLNGSVAGSDDVGNSSSLNNQSQAGNNKSCNKSANSKSSQGLKSSNGISNMINGVDRDQDMQTASLLDQTGGGIAAAGESSSSRAGSQDRIGILGDSKVGVLTTRSNSMASASIVAQESASATTAMSPNNSTLQSRSGDNNKLYNTNRVNEIAGKTQQAQVQDNAAGAAVMPIQPPSTSAAAATTTTASSSSSSSSTLSTASTVSSSNPSSTSSSPPLSVSSYGEYSLLGPGATFELPCLRVRSAQI